MYKEWTDYFSDRSDANRNAVFELHWPLIKNQVRLALIRRHLLCKYEDILSYVTQRTLEVSIPKYDPDRLEVRAYLKNEVRYSVKLAIRLFDPVSRYCRDRITQVRKARIKLSHVYQRNPTDAEVAQELGLSELQIIEADLRISHPTPYDATAASSDTLDEILAGLDEYHQLLLRQYYLYGCSIRDIAREMGTTIHRIHEDLKFAKKFLKKSNKTPSISQ